MTLKTGTLTIVDLLAETTQTVIAYGTDTVAAVLAADLANHNTVLRDSLSLIAETTADKLRRDGAASVGEMILADEFSRAPTQKVSAGQTVGFPLEGFQYAIGWTQKFLNRATPRDLAIQQQAAERAHIAKTLAQLKRAIYSPTNVTFVDYLDVPQIDLPVKRWYNADSTTIPAGPNGESFDGSTHTHFLAYATLTAAAAAALVDTVAEHRSNTNIKVAINAADEAAWRALSNFVAYPDPRLFAGNSDSTARQALSLANPGNRAIGMLGLAEVWVKPWAISNYPVAWDMAAERKPLAMRTRTGTDAGLVRVASNNAFPLIADFYEAEFGFGAQNRGAAAVLFVGDTTYAAPTITG